MDHRPDHLRERWLHHTLICHGAGLLLWTRLSNGKLLADGKKWTGFTDEEEAAVNVAFGMTLND